MRDVEPGVSVRIAERWATTASERSVGVVTRVFMSTQGGQWATVRFNERDDITCMVRELELAMVEPHRDDYLDGR